MKFPSMTLLLVGALAASISEEVEGFTATNPVSLSSVYKSQQARFHQLQSTATRDDQKINNGQGNTESEEDRVDMNIYNLPLEQAIQEWTANLVTESAMVAEGIYLGAKSSRDVFVDTERIIGIKRRQGQGLGIELLEIAGGREDGLGITIVEGLVPGGASEGRGLLPGDCISKIAVHRTGQPDEIASVATECLGWDATVEAIGSLPAIETPNEYLILTIKRLRRKPKVTVNFQYPPDQGEEDTTIELFAGENLRRAMLVKGIKLNDPLSKRFDSGGSGDCGAEGTCATCSVSVMEGMDLLNEPGLTEKQMLENKPRWRMACRAIVGYGMKEGKMTVRVNPRQWN
ncbi:Ferredoxin [Seminavis robusta]|uniref:Ferredoxin n=1 Tax=Seminavis robusta TaxID=568900 RepID=A0A9N8F065_9STRA|nr:Ferredoxin [Seminavis robusta]|eukprot:Sro2882_g339260.1 Ferredoxin (345) ;mRNA; f:2928-3962